MSSSIYINQTWDKQQFYRYKLMLKECHTYHKPGYSYITLMHIPKEHVGENEDEFYILKMIYRLHNYPYSFYSYPHVIHVIRRFEEMNFEPKDKWAFDDISMFFKNKEDAIMYKILFGEHINKEYYTTLRDI